MNNGIDITQYNKIKASIILNSVKVKQNKKIIIGISGIPGAGKTTFTKILKNMIQNDLQIHQELKSNGNDKIDSSNICNVIPLDGYHKYLKDLPEDLVYVRGCIESFDMEKFKKDLNNLANSPDKDHLFPSFEHNIKDPIEDDICVKANCPIIIIEGLYLFVKNLVDIKLFDIKVFIRTDIDQAILRLAKRNFEAKICKTYEETLKRSNITDRSNALFVLENSDLSDIIDLNFIE